MFNCPFFEEHPDLFLLLVGLLFLGYLCLYGLYCLILFLLCLYHQRGTSATVNTLSVYLLPSVVS